MIRRVYRAGLAACLLGGCMVAAHPDDDPVRLTETRRLMGVQWSITLYAPDEKTGRAAVGAGFAEVARLERILSDYDPASELSRLSAAAPTAAPVPVGGDLWDLLVRATALREATDGAFDITVGPLTSLWRQARRSGRLPRPDKLAAALAAVGPETMSLHVASRTVGLRRAGMRLDPGGIGMGYAADRVLALLTARGVRSALVDASGDVAVSGPPPGSAGWRVAVDPLGDGFEPLPSLTLEHAAVTTSGDAYQAVEIEGVRYSHVVDPRTGLGVTGAVAATVIAADCTTADALATAASVLGPTRGMAAVARFPGAAVHFTWRQGDAVRTASSPGWPEP